MSRRPHGGDLDRAAAIFGSPAEGWLDLSTGINPWPYPLPALSGGAWTRLPDAAGLDELATAARDAYGVDPEAAIVAAPGTQALIQAVPRLAQAGEVRVLGPTYGEHAPAWALAGHNVAETSDLAALADGLRAVVVCNPNNPDGRRLPKDTLMTLARQLDEAGGVLVVDEAFADVAPEASLAPVASAPGLVVLRSFGKFFGLAGVRLGFALAAPGPARRLVELLGPWAVSGPAIEVGRQALSDGAWIADTRRRLAGEAAALMDVLAGAGLGDAGGTDLFRLARTTNAAALQQRLAAAGIWVRIFPERPGLVRFGLPGGDGPRARLAAALASG